MQIGRYLMKNSANYYAQNNRIKWLYLLGIVFLGVSAVLGIIMGSTSDLPIVKKSNRYARFVGRSL